MIYCDYGCGQEAKFLITLKMGNKNCCSKHYSKCPSNIKTWNKGLNKNTDERVLKYANSRLGIKPWNKGLNKNTDERVKIIAKKISDSSIGKIVSEETRNKIRKFAKGRKFSEETRKKISDANKGKIISEITRKKLSDSLKGKSLSEETRKKISLSLKGRKSSEETIKKISEKNRGKKLTKEQICKFIQSKTGTKYNMRNFYIKNHKRFIDIDNPIFTNFKDIKVLCCVCNKEFKPKRDQIYYRCYCLENNLLDNGKFYCSSKCKEKNMYIKTDENKVKFIKYYRLVMIETNRSLKINKEKINNFHLRSLKFHLDHIFSINEGFKRNVNPEIIGHWKNLRILKYSDNLKKFDKCDIELNELLNIIDQDS